MLVNIPYMEHVGLCNGSDPILDAMENPFLQMKFTECHPRLLNPECHSMVRTMRFHTLLNHG